MTKRRAETRANLIEAAFRVFADKGFGQVRIDDVCAAAGYTRGAFYSNFDSLEELFFTLYDESARLIAGQVTEALTADDINPGVEAVIERVTATLLLDRDWLLIKTDFLLHAARNPAVADRLATHRQELRNAIEKRLDGARQRLTLPDAISDIPNAARAVVAAYDGVTVQLLLDGDLQAGRSWLTQLLTALLDR
ncbi:TetR/AcrR family transcriptional regulator [Mycobacterium sp.]|uniref:TetR/AcrR family transcriptional regulator n=1 Tax=Mycobacterium sp. TaxID=1785 RepID=UPI00333FD2AC|nr:transcriptional regulatory protein [Mycobacterium sp.]